jgi:hypothetical protein
LLSVITLEPMDFPGRMRKEYFTGIGTMRKWIIEFPPVQ